MGDYPATVPRSSERSIGRRRRSLLPTLLKQCSKRACVVRRIPFFYSSIISIYCRQVAPVLRRRAHVKSSLSAKGSTKNGRYWNGSIARRARREKSDRSLL